jgi:hypothetical protein
MTFSTQESVVQPLRVGASHVGRGIFATRLIEEDELIAEIHGRLVPGRDYGSATCIELTPDVALEPAEPFTLINHSCAPNCEFFSWDDDEHPEDRMKVWLAALRRIEPGEELTIDYAWEAEAAIPCQCHSANCRGWIVDESELAGLRRQMSRRR